MASRYDLRSVVIQSLFECDFHNNFELSNLKNILRRNFNQEVLKIDLSNLELFQEVPEFAERLALGVLAKKEIIDELNKECAPDYPLDKIDTINKNILRLGIFELLFGEEMNIPKKVAINESVELAKAFGGDTSYKFVNGVLANIYKDLEREAA